MKNLNNEVLPFPKFLAFNYEGMNFYNEFQSKIGLDLKIQNELIKEHGNKNTIILYNGELVFNDSDSNSLDINADLNSNEIVYYKSQKTKTQFENLNQQNLNSALTIKAKKDSQLKVIVAFSQNICHYSLFEVLDNANCKITQEFVSFNNATINYNAKVNCNNYSNLNLSYYIDINSKNSSVFNYYANVQESANLSLNYLNVSSSNTVNVANVFLNNLYASANVNTASFVNDHYIFANLINVENLSKHTNGTIENVGVVNNFGRLVIDGINLIEKGFSKSQADQHSKIVNLTDTAMSVANPQLIINEFDVKAGHAAAVGRIDEDQLYYLQSRGLRKFEATELLLLSYVQEIFEKIDDDKIIENAKKAIKLKVR